ncbi:hypothetical protein Poli38472_006047 [Pythium oligandrum]|uniref:Ribokinase n=1 Tax=Pythium oligandrum TaxID=41045 RepID=A0A8K1FPP5_PYTOL|nr:hypothetical protein Poli38472_006047 [Pythium oligandrum]|eukprot:TMW68579.1 hypothetical protein Poli38472_006047 [Pythium oligandrum]
MAKTIVVVGSVNADFVIEVDRLPARGETFAASKTDTGRFFPGGKGANQAAAVARLAPSSEELQCQFVGQFGNDAHAVELEKALANVGVDIALSGNPACPSGQAFVFVYPDGDNSIVIVGGANATWPSALPEPVIKAIQSAAIVLLQSEIPSSVNYQVAQCAASAKVPVLWDCGGEDRKIPADILPLITFLCPNETELARLTDRSVDSIESAVTAARLLQEQGAQNLVVTLGSQGSVFVPADPSTEPTHQPCIPVDRVVDTTGAGDCFRAAFAAAQAQDKSIAESLKFAAAASALCVQVPGALPSMPTASETSRVLNL